MPQGSNCSFNSMKKSLGFFLEMPPLACHVSYTNVYMHGINKVYGDFSLQVRYGSTWMTTLKNCARYSDLLLNGEKMKGGVESIKISENLFKN